MQSRFRHLLEDDRRTPEEVAAQRASDGQTSRIRSYHLETGALYYFDTTRVHSLVNSGAGERITLSFDLVANAWLVERFPAIRAEIGDDPIAPLPRPGGVRCALAFARSRFYPLRNLARRRFRARGSEQTH